MRDDKSDIDNKKEVNIMCAPSEAWQFLLVKVQIRQRLAISLTPIPRVGG